MKKIQTNWIVFSGVTSSGKTTIADLLIRYGYKAPIEVARVYINELQAEMTPQQLGAFVQTYEFQHQIARRGLQFEQGLDPSDIVIIDCGLIGSFVYFQLRDHIIQEGHYEPLQEHLDSHRYRGVFLFEKLPCDADPCRFSTAETLREKAHDLIKEVNLHQGYTSIDVPILPVEERLKFVLQKMITMVPTLMYGYGLKNPSGADEFTLQPINKSAPKMLSYGLKNYSGLYSSLFFGNGSNCVDQKYNARSLDTLSM